MYCKPPIAKKQKEWVLDKGPQTEVNYEKYGHQIAMPGQVISAKTGKLRQSNSLASYNR
jgi:hypothetical protein